MAEARRLVAALALLAAWPVAAAAETVPPGAVAVVGDGIPRPLTDRPGDPARGRAIVVDRQKGLCLLCHTGPFPEQRFPGTLAPDLAGAGSRWNEAQLRLRLVDGRLLNPDSIMPAYYRIDGFVRVARAFAGRPILEAQDVEDVVAFLATLREEPVKKESP
ncbi:sulfur oxidation c-type cytochrome SoxX [uncultured Alsobacter sp.]|uniref:sulfur oxidation c-type cytochrome SoxX n=1 Tax=uncultured Alsobacter sp. TaxID=1748258 RepID=UPI0025E6DDD5|nr:sulfur oxidation c-type cytochrome SoxX [uncultured Alsobacter sp.]